MGSVSENNMDFYPFMAKQMMILILIHFIFCISSFAIVRMAIVCVVMLMWGSWLNAGVQPWWIQGDPKVGTELASLEITYLITDREGLEN